jgi:hypothetical protein
LLRHVDLKSGEGFLNSDYALAIATNNVSQMYGLLHAHTATAGADLSWDIVDAVGVFGFYQFQWVRGLQRSNRSATQTAAEPYYTSDMPGVWTVRTTDRYDSIGCGIDVRPSKTVAVQAGYDLSKSRGAMEYQTINSQNTATLVNPPDTITTKHVYRLGADVKSTENVSWGLGYAFEKYAVRDFANQNLSLTAGQAATATGQTNVTIVDNSGDYKAHVVSAKVKLRW